MKIIDFEAKSCRHCYKCVRNCNVKAISIQNEQAHIMTEHCIHCGHCLEVCPQNAKTFASDLDRVRSYIRQGMKTIVSVAPSYLGILDYKQPGQVADALYRLGFFEVRETAEGAALVTEEYGRLLKQGKMRNIITTCCPSINDLIEKYYPDLVDEMAPVVSPMVAHGRLIRELHGEDVKIVFLGPCIAKKSEAEDDERVAGAIDAIITFEELLEWLKEESIQIAECQEREFANPNPSVNRLYPVSGGIMLSVLEEHTSDQYKKVHVDGIEACMELFEGMQNGQVAGCFAEVNVCNGGCIRGPASTKWSKTYVPGKLKIERQLPKREKMQLQKHDVKLHKEFYDRHFDDLLPTSEELTEILKEMGKFSEGDELNCGACGYASCQDKAIAVFQNKAEVNMCVPYALTQAESMANVVMDETPNLIFVVDREFRIHECNKAAQRCLGISHEEALKSYIFEYFDEKRIEQVLNTKEDCSGEKLEMKREGLVLEETIVYIKAMDAALVVYRDITTVEREKEKHMRFKMESVDMAQQVIDKQMMVAQQIAGLLGETTAETKATLSKLRDSILSED